MVSRCPTCLYRRVITPKTRMFSGQNQNHLPGQTILSVCYPYSKTITCVCDIQGQVVNCFPTKGRGFKDNTIGRVGGAREENLSLAMEDNITEILLATTTLVAVIAFFLGFVFFWYLS